VEQILIIGESIVGWYGYSVVHVLGCMIGAVVLGIVTLSGGGLPLPCKMGRDPVVFKQLTIRLLNHLLSCTQIKQDRILYKKRTPHPRVSYLPQNISYHVPFQILTPLGKVILKMSAWLSKL
jgi:hypothetical protein